MHVHYILPIRRTGYATLHTMIAQGQLQANSEAQLQHAPLKGSLYSPTHPQPIQAQSDYQISVGQYTLPTDVYRLPSAEYTALVRGSPNYQQSPRLAELLHLTAQHHVDYEWLPAGPMGQKPLGFLPQENSFTATWDSWRWACLERSGEWFLVMWFHLNFLDPGYKVFATEVALDLGADPLVCAAEPGAVVYSVTPATLTPTAEVEQLPDGLIKEMRMPPSSGILMGYDNKKPDWRRRHYVIRPVVPLAEKSTVARPTSPHHDHLDAGWSDALQIHSSSAVVLFSSLRKPDKRKARNGGSSVPSFSRRFQEQRSFKLF